MRERRRVPTAQDVLERVERLGACFGETQPSEDPAAEAPTRAAVQIGNRACRPACQHLALLPRLLHVHGCPSDRRSPGLIFALAVVPLFCLGAAVVFVIAAQSYERDRASSHSDAALVCDGLNPQAA